MELTDYEEMVIPVIASARQLMCEYKRDFGLKDAVFLYIKNELDNVLGLQTYSSSRYDGAFICDNYWLVNPGEGEDSDSLCITISHMVGGHAVFGAVSYGQDIYYAMQGHGAYKLRDNRTTSIKTSGRSEGICAGVKYPHLLILKKRMVNRISPILKNASKVRSFTSTSLGMCLVASGTLDLFVEFNIRDHTDAGRLILEEAGGAVVCSGDSWFTNDIYCINSGI